MQEEPFFTRFPKLRIPFFFVISLLVVGLLTFITYRTIFSATITVIAAPYDSQIYLDGKEITNKETIRIRPSDYTIIVERGGFETEEKVVEIRRNENARVMFALLPSDGNYEWYINHPEDSLILDSVMSSKSTDKEIQIVEEFPVLNKLPHRTNFYELTLFALPSVANSKITFTLSIYEVPRDGIFATPEKFIAYSEECRIWLAEHGLSSDEYEIVSANEF